MRLRSVAWAALLGAAALGRAQPLEVVSALGPEVERRALEAVQSARNTYSELGLSLRKPHLPTQIVIVPTVVELAPHIGSSTGRSRAFSFAGADRNSIVLAWIAPGNPLRAAAHEYAHLVDPLEDAPLWFREGLAEYLSYYEEDEEGRLAPAAPARHVVRLRDSDWLPVRRLLEAGRDSADAAAPTFYAQSWLLVDWLAAQGTPPRRLRPELLSRELERLGTAGLESALQARLAEVDGSPLVERGPVEALAPLSLDQMWRVELALAETDRELGRLEKARRTLERLRLQRPEEPLIAAALGALAMDEGRYEEAERMLAEAAEGAEATARTRYRLALMLLRPAGEEGRARARRAVRQASLALERFPDSPEYRLALSQALMVDEQWEASARELNRLAAEPAWRQRADQEYAELARRRQQAMGAVERPALAQPPAAHTAPAQPIETPPVPRPPKPPPPPPMRWPPPGATILAGRIDYVDCSGPEKIIVMRHPLLTMRIRERKGKPAKLFHPPENWTEIPCGAKGWTVNVAYYPDRDDDSVLGDAAAILF